MTTLRKACHNCTASKRKCIAQLPKCTRCVQRGLECIYDLEPLNKPIGLPRELPKMSWNASACDTPGYCVFKTLRIRPSDIDPAICRPGHEDSIELMRFMVESVPELVREGKPALFVHPKLQPYSNDNYIHAFGQAGNGDVSYDSLQRLLSIDVKTKPVKEALEALQVLILHLGDLLFLAGEAEQIYAEKLLPALSEWAHSLLASAQTRMPRGQSPWQRWLFGESVRRTIVMSYAIIMGFWSFKYGYCWNWLFVESLPFDSRAGLWMAESPQAWIAAARVKTGEEVGEQLRSWHEFAAENLNGREYDFCGDLFLALFAFGHNGGRTGSSHELRL